MRNYYNEHMRASKHVRTFCRPRLLINWPRPLIKVARERFIIVYCSFMIINESCTILLMRMLGIEWGVEQNRSIEPWIELPAC